MKTLDIGAVTPLLTNYAANPEQDPVILTVKGKPVAVMLPTLGADVETISLSFNAKFLAIMERSRRQLDREGGISSEEIRRHFGLPPFAEGDSGVRNNKPRGTATRRKVTSQKRNRKSDGGNV